MDQAIAFFGLRTGDYDLHTPLDPLLLHLLHGSFLEDSRAAFCSVKRKVGKNMLQSPVIGHSPGLTKEEELWPRRQESEVRAELVSRYLAYAKSIALRYRGQAESVEDLVQVASVGLMNAIERFDPSNGTPFVGFASPTIHGELKRHFRDRVSTLRVPRSVYERIGNMEAVVAQLRSSLSHEPGIEEIAEAMGCSSEAVLEARTASQVRNPIGFSEGDDDGEWPSEEHLGSEDEGYELAEYRLVTEEAIKSLDAEDQAILNMRYHDELTQSQIAARLGCSQMQVSRRLRSILNTMNSSVSGDTPIAA